MDEHEAPTMIANQIHSDTAELNYLSVTGNINKAVGIFTAYTRSLFSRHDHCRTKSAMALADKIHRHGNSAVKNAIENIFIASFTQMYLLCKPKAWQTVRADIPNTLYNVYMHQVNASGC